MNDERGVSLLADLTGWKHELTATVRHAWQALRSGITVPPDTTGQEVLRMAKEHKRVRWLNGVPVTITHVWLADNNRRQRFSRYIVEWEQDNRHRRVSEEDEAVALLNTLRQRPPTTGRTRSRFSHQSILLATGSRRAVYDLQNGCVKKVALNDYGNKANREEADVYRRMLAIPRDRWIIDLAEVVDHDPSGSWLIQRKHNTDLPADCGPFFRRLSNIIQPLDYNLANLGFDEEKHTYVLLDYENLDWTWLDKAANPYFPNYDQPGTMLIKAMSTYGARVDQSEQAVLERLRRGELNVDIDTLGMKVTTSRTWADGLAESINPFGLHYTYLLKPGNGHGWRFVCRPTYDDHEEPEVYDSFKLFCREEFNDPAASLLKDRPHHVVFDLATADRTVIWDRALRIAKWLGQERLHESDTDVNWHGSFDPDDIATARFEQLLCAFREEFPALFSSVQSRSGEEVEGVCWYIAPLIEKWWAKQHVKVLTIMGYYDDGHQAVFHHWNVIRVDGEFVYLDGSYRQFDASSDRLRVFFPRDHAYAHYLPD